MENFVLKLPKSPNIFGIQSVNNYYKKLNLKEKFRFTKIQSDKAQPAITCSKLAIETLEQGVKYVQS